MVMYLRFAVNSHVHNQRHRITPLESPQNLSSIVFFSKGFWPLSDMLADQMYYIRNSFGLVKSLFKVTLNQSQRCGRTRIQSDQTAFAVPEWN